jgi:hypothetical protein
VIVRVHRTLKGLGVGGPIKELRRDAQCTDLVASGPDGTNLVGLANARHQYGTREYANADDLASLDEKLDGLVRNFWPAFDWGDKQRFPTNVRYWR